MRIIKSSKNIKASDSYNLDDETYKYVTNVDGYWVYRAIVDGKGVWRAMPQDSDESQFEELSFPISYDQARGFEPIDEPSAITKLRKDLGKKLLPKAGQSVEATEDLSMYPESFKNAYTVAKKDFKKDYKRAHADVQIYPSDPYLGVEEGEIVLQITGFNPYGKKCSGTVSVDESLDSNILYQAMKETAEDLGIRKGSFDIKNSTSGNMSIKATRNKNSSVRLQMKEELMDQILPEIKSKLKEVMTSPRFGFSYTEWRDYSGADIYLNNDGYFVVTVYAEVSYNGLVDIMDALNPIVEKYDPDAYFDADTPGRCSAYIDPDNIPSNMYPDVDMFGSEEIEGSISPEDFFTKDDLVDFVIEIEDTMNERINPKQKFNVEDAYIEGKKMYVSIYNDEYQLSGEVSIDMRKIRKPSDLIKYKNSMINQMIEQYNQYSSIESSTVYSNSYDDYYLGDDITYNGQTYVIVNDENNLLTLRPKNRFKDSDFENPELGDSSEDILLEPWQIKQPNKITGASNEVELDPEESMIDMNLDQYIIVDSEGGWNYDSDNYNWASSDGEGSDWYSETGVRLDDPTGVVEKIDELIEPHVPIEPGTYRVEGYIELYYTVSGVYENRYDYTEDDYSSDINSDFGSAEYNKKLSKIEDIKVTKI